MARNPMVGKTVSLSLLALGTLALAPAAAAYSPGWYFGVEGFYSQTVDSDGKTVQNAVPGSPGSPAVNNCLLGDLLGLGSLVDGLGGTGPQGCLIGLLGPGSDPIDPTTGIPGAEFATTISYKGGIGGGVNIGYLFEGGLRPEISLNYTEAELDEITLDGVSFAVDSTKLKAMRVMANAWYDLDFGGKVVPYIGGGFGYQQTELDGDDTQDDSGIAFQLGAGIGFYVNDRTTISLDYRFVNADDPTFDSGDGQIESEYQSHNVGLGLRYSFGAGARDSDGDGVPDRLDKCPGTPPNVAVYSDGCPVDVDGDGVPDYLDKCPGTPAGTKVTADGCNTADSDGDGIPDDQDKCPGTPSGVAVGPDGCPLDSDGDGIPDYLDECPRTPPGAKVLPNGCALVGDCRTPRPGEQVDANGCAVDKNFILKGVKFEFDSDRLTPEAKEILNQVAETLQAYPNVNVTVEGHTDNIGSDSYNLGLSERRAIAVKAYLGGKGVVANRMTPVGFGESRPIDSNESDAGRENNRRVELSVKE